MYKVTRSIVTLVALFALVCGFSLTAEAKKGESLSGVVNINSATAEELVLLPGVGPSKAEAIIAHRDAQRFETVEDIMKVKGVGQNLFNKIRANITVDGPTTAKMTKEGPSGFDTLTEDSEG